MYTCCPECKTTFRLSAGDLRRGKGRVRCGDCGEVFNAVEHLAEDPAEEILAEESTAADHDPVTPELTNPELTNPELSDALARLPAGSAAESPEGAEKTYDDNSGIYSIGDPEDIQETPRISLSGEVVAETISAEPAMTAYPDSANDAVDEADDASFADSMADSVVESFADAFADSDAENDAAESVGIIVSEEDVVITEPEAATSIAADDAGIALLLDAEDEFDDTVWERIPGVGSDESVDSVTDDPIFARPAEPIFGAPDLPEDADFAAAADDLPALQLPDGPDEDITPEWSSGAIEVPPDFEAELEAEGALKTDTETGPETDMEAVAANLAEEDSAEETDFTDTSFRDEFEPIEATHADTLEFNAPETAWSDIFTATGSVAMETEQETEQESELTSEQELAVVEDSLATAPEDEAADTDAAEPVASDACIQGNAPDALSGAAEDAADSEYGEQSVEAAYFDEPVNSVAPDPQQDDDERWSGTLTEWEHAASETLAAIAATGQATEANDEVHDESPDVAAEPAEPEVAGSELLEPAADLEQEAADAWSDAAEDVQDEDETEDAAGDDPARDSGKFDYDEQSVDSIAARTMGLKHGEYDVQHIVLEDESDSAGLTQTFSPERDEVDQEEYPPPWQTGGYEHVATAKKSKTWLWFTGGLVLLVVLAVQLVHYNRDALAASTAWGGTVRGVYAQFGMELYPEWSTINYEIRSSEAVAGESGPNIMDIRAQIAAIGDAPTGLPHLRVVLRDRWSNSVAARQFSPAEYNAGTTLPADGIMQPNDTIAAHVTIADPGSGAQGFELEICMPRRHTGLECTGLLSKK